MHFRNTDYCTYFLFDRVFFLCLFIRYQLFDRGIAEKRMISFRLDCHFKVAISAVEPVEYSHHAKTLIESETNKTYKLNRLC